MSRILSLFFFILLFAGTPYGCVSAPVQEMSDARQALQAAQVAGAEEHAAEVLYDARRLLQQAEQELDQRHFQNAREHALRAKERAIVAREAAQHANP